MSMTLEMAWRTRPLQLALSGGPVTPTPIREYNGLRGENRGPFKGQQAAASNPVMSECYCLIYQAVFHFIQYVARISLRCSQRELHISVSLEFRQKYSFYIKFTDQLIWIALPKSRPTYLWGKWFIHQTPLGQPVTKAETVQTPLQNLLFGNLCKPKLQGISTAMAWEYYLYNTFITRIPIPQKVFTLKWGPRRDEPNENSRGIRARWPWLIASVALESGSSWKSCNVFPSKLHC